jgi:hypothetical protein
VRAAEGGPPSVGGPASETAPASRTSPGAKAPMPPSSSMRRPLRAHGGRLVAHHSASATLSWAWCSPPSPEPRKRDEPREGRCVHARGGTPAAGGAIAGGAAPCGAPSRRASCGRATGG